MKHLTTMLNRKYSIIVLIVMAFAAGFFVRDGSKPDTSSEYKQDAMPDKKAEIWTCSMHPQIQKPGPGKCPICFMDLIPLETDDTESGSLRELTISEASAALMDIQTTAVDRRFVTVDIRMAGEVDYDETLVSDITAWVPGRLDRLFVDYTGVPVKKGEHMVELYSPELLSAQQELIQAIQASKNLQQSNVTIVRETTDATVEAVREKLRLWGLSAEQIAHIEQQGTASEHITINSPVSGIVVHKNAQQGMYVQTGTKIYTIADLSKVWVRLDAYESDLMWLKYGQRIEFTTEAYPGETFEGRISFIDPILHAATRTVKIRVNVPNPDMRLKPGMFVRATVQAKVGTDGKVIDNGLAGKWISPMHPEVIKDEPGNCDICGMPLVKAETLGYVGAEASDANKPLVIPASAPLLTGKRAIVYVQLPNTEKPTFEGREIVLGPRARNSYIVKRGLAQGERVVTKGNFKLDSELQIRAKPSMMTPDGGGAASVHAHHDQMDMPTTEDQSDTMQHAPIPALVLSQLQAVTTAAQHALDMTKGNDLILSRQAFRELTSSVDAVSAHLLKGPVAAIWKEYAMLLGNDGIEGQGAKTKHDLLQTAELTKQHLNDMQKKLGLRQRQSHTVTTAIDQTFKAQLNNVIDQYLALQTALASDDPATAQQYSKQALEALNHVDMTRVSGETHMQWIKQNAQLKKILSEMATAKDIEPLRKSFALLSEQMAETIRTFQPTEGNIYEFHCPMAFNNRGANWLQANDNLANPYFGQMMLKCGSVEDVLPGSK